MIVLVCGGRGYARVATVITVMDEVHGTCAITRLVTGAALGADFLAERWADLRGVPVVNYPADWKAYGRAAGPVRNQRMLANEQPDLVVAFPGGKGTADMVRRARAAGVPVREVS